VTAVAVPLETVATPGPATPGEGLVGELIAMRVPGHGVNTCVPPVIAAPAGDSVTVAVGWLMVTVTWACGLLPPVAVAVSVMVPFPRRPSPSRSHSRSSR